MAYMKDVTAYTDGAARGNPDGPGGYGAVLQYTDRQGILHEKEYSAGYKKTTNNRMELMGVITALEALNSPCHVVLHTDSSYVVNAFNKGWLAGWQKNNWRTSGRDPVKNKDLWLRLIKAADKHDVEFIWVKGHAGNELNERCDVLATSAADGDVLLDDTVQE
jgi:ribonuclease HI